MFSSKLSELRTTEWSPRFASLFKGNKDFKKIEPYMRNRLVQGSFRYGKLKAEGKPQFDRIDRARRELNLFVSDGNLEHLVDGMNMLLLEFEEVGDVNMGLAGLFLSMVKKATHFKSVESVKNVEKN